MKSWQKLLDTAVDIMAPDERIVTFKSIGESDRDSDYGFKKFGDNVYSMVERSKFQDGDDFRYIFTVKKISGDLLHVYHSKFNMHIDLTIHIDNIECDIF